MHRISLSSYRLILASPNDVSEERRIVRDLVDEINELYLREKRVILQMYSWETNSYPGFYVEGPQGLIDEVLRIEEADIFVGIFWKRFGTTIEKWGKLALSMRLFVLINLGRNPAGLT